MESKFLVKSYGAAVEKFRAPITRNSDMGALDGIAYSLFGPTEQDDPDLAGPTGAQPYLGMIGELAFGRRARQMDERQVADALRNTRQRIIDAEGNSELRKAFGQGYGGYHKEIMLGAVDAFAASLGSQLPGFNQAYQPKP